MEFGAHQAEEQPLPPLPSDSFLGFSSVFRDQDLGSVHYRVLLWETMCVAHQVTGMQKVFG